MNEYELTYITKVGLTKDKSDRVEARIARAFEKQAGHVLRNRDIGERSLAYPIRKEGRGHYLQLNFLGEGLLVDELESELRIIPEVLRFLTIRLSRAVDIEAKKQEYIELAKPVVTEEVAEAKETAAAPVASEASATETAAKPVEAAAPAPTAETATDTPTETE